MRPGLEEHDQGVLLRPQRDQRRRLAAGRVREVHAAQGRRARRRDDGRGHRLRVRAVGLGGRAQGRQPGGRGEGQGLLRGPGREGRQARAHHRREGRGPAGADHPDRRLQRPRGLRPRHRGRLRVGRAQAGGVPRGDEGDRAGRAAVLQHLHAADHASWRRASSARRSSSGCTSSPRSTRCRSSRSSAASARRTRRWPRRSTWRWGMQEDPDRRQRQPRLLHLARDRHVHQRGRRDGRRGDRPADRRAGVVAGGLPAPVLQLLDELTLTLPQKIRKEARAAWSRRAAPGYRTRPRP